MVYQHFMLVGSLTVAENAMLGQGRGLRLDPGAVEAELTRLSERYRLQVDPRARIWQLSVGEQQRVEILRLLYRGAKILIFDEPTAVLTPQESEELVRTLRHMAAEGFCITFISHKLDEVTAASDRVTVLRRGRVVTTIETRNTDRHALARLMVGREVLFNVERLPTHPGDVVLDVRALHAQGDRDLPALQGIDLTVRSGEILGIAGVAGNGQRELAEVITGLRKPSGGQVRIGGADMAGCSSREVIAAGVAHVPEDRLGTGLISTLDLSDNVILKDYRRPPLANGPFLDGAAVARFTDGLVKDYNIAAPSHATRAGLLSGGNQQKLLLARELSGQPRVLVAVHPTRGVDVGATEAIHRLLLAQRGQGAAVLLISEDLDELLALSDRIAVIYGGKIMGTVDIERASVEEIGLMMAGVQPEVGSRQSEAPG
jgi:simple sugar transport system ATP-binding protein